MTKLRPGLGSYTAELGHSRRPHFRDRLLRLDLIVSLRQMSDPVAIGLAPRPVTEDSTSNPKESVHACGNLACRNDGKTVAARRPSED
jgi:hypothetical protein